MKTELTKYNLNDKVWIVRDVTQATEPCEKCDIIGFERNLEVTEAEIGIIDITISVATELAVSYRIMVNGVLQDMEWRTEDKIFATQEEAEQYKQKLEEEKTLDE